MRERSRSEQAREASTISQSKDPKPGMAGKRPATRLQGPIKPEPFSGAAAHSCGPKDAEDIANGPKLHPQASGAESNRRKLDDSPESQDSTTPAFQPGPGETLVTPMQTQSTVSTDPTHLALMGGRAIDGDTIEAAIQLPLGVAVMRRVRLKGFLAPEHSGSNPEKAHEAQRRLQNVLDLQECHLLVRGSKEDKYGRVVATLIVNGRAANPFEILQDCQLTEAQHSHDLDLAKRFRTRKGGAL